MRKIRFILFVSLLLYSQIIYSDSLAIKLQNIKTKYQLVGLSVAVTKNNQLVFNQSLGKKDISRNLDMNDSSVYRIASISKMITATALMQLWEQGKFGLDDDISRYIGFICKNPYFPNDSITFRKILSHTSSLRDGSGYDGFLSATYNNNPPPNLSSLLVQGSTYYSSDMWSSTKRPNANYFTYSNINFGVVGTLVEKLSGERFDIYCKNHIFQPLNISGSFNVSDIANINNVAILYRKSGSSWVAQADNFNGIKPTPRDLSSYVIGNNGVIFGPQGGVRISSYDLTKIMIAHSNNGVYNGVRILNANTLDTMHKSIWIYNGSNGDNYYGIFNAYGFGNHRTTNLLPGNTLIGHPGEAYGLISDMYYEQSGQFGIIFITSGGVWGYGVYSGWYNVEEEIYNAAKSELQNLTNIKDENINYLPKDFKVFPNYPNPFNPNTTLEFELPKESFVNISIFNTLGEKVDEIFNNFSKPGKIKLNWQAKNLPSNTYFCVFNIKETYSNNNYLEKLKMIYLK